MIKQDLQKYSKEKSTILSCDSGIKTFKSIYVSSTGDDIDLNVRKSLLNKIKQSRSKKVPYKLYKNKIYSERPI